MKKLTEAQMQAVVEQIEQEPQEVVESNPPLRAAWEKLVEGLRQKRNARKRKEEREHGHTEGGHGV